VEEAMRRHVSLLIALVPIFSAVVAVADQPDVASRIDQVFAEYSAAGSPGACVSVIRDGEVVFSKGYGLANLELEVPVTPKSVFYLGSVSKQFVAAAVVLLEQEGTLSFDDDIRTYVPEFPDYGTPITIRHLIHHTSGIRGADGPGRVAARHLS
jgi:CubicO group peptidase (beta-lactamase class C family)